MEPKNLQPKTAPKKRQMQPSENITVNRDELREAKKTAKPGEPLCYNIGPNRKQRREQLKTDRYKAEHKGKADERPFVNNRGGKGKKVFEKMAYFYLRLGDRKYHVSAQS